MTNGTLTNAPSAHGACTAILRMGMIGILDS